MQDTFVLDCSVAAKCVLPEPGSAPALGLFGQYALGEVLLIAPDILLAEFAIRRATTACRCSPGSTISGYYAVVGQQNSRRHAISIKIPENRGEIFGQQV